MALRTVLEVPVDDQEFQAFMNVFNKYQQVVSRLPAAWKNINVQMNAGKGPISANTAALVAQLNALNQSQLAAQKMSQYASTMNTSFTSLSRNAGTFARHIKEATVDLARWTGITTALAGLVGAGGLFGIERLAMNASSMRQGAMGIGVNPGQQQAFSVAMRGAIGPQFLQGVFEAMNRVENRVFLGQAGIRGNLAGRNPVDVAWEALSKLQDQYKRAAPGTLGTVLETSGGAGLGHTLNNAELLRNMSKQELANRKKEYDQNILKFALQDQQLQQLQELDRQLAAVGTKFEMSFFPALARSSDAIEKLSQAFGDALSAFIKSDVFKHWVDVSTQALEDFAGYAGSDKFKSDMKDLTTGIGELAAVVGKAVTGLVQGVQLIKGIIDVVRGYSNEPQISDEQAKRYGFMNQDFSWWNPGSWMPSAHIPGTAPWEDPHPFRQPRGGRSALTPEQYNAIARAEGTFNNGAINYDATYAGSRPGLSGMSLNEVLALQQQMTAQGGHSPVGGFQITRDTLQDAAKALGYDPATTQFSPSVQQGMAGWLYGKRGTSPWAGFQVHPGELQRFNQGSGAGLNAPGLTGPNASIADKVVATAEASAGQHFHNMCAALVNHALKTAGLPTSANNMANSFRTYGDVVVKDVARGDIFYSGPSGMGDTGHVGVVEGPMVNGKVRVMSSHLIGDMNNPAGVEWRDATGMEFHRPNYPHSVPQPATAPPGVRVQIQNNTGGDHAISVSQLGFG